MNTECRWCINKHLIHHPRFHFSWEATRKCRICILTSKKNFFLPGIHLSAHQHVRKLPVCRHFRRALLTLRRVVSNYRWRLQSPRRVRDLVKDVSREKSASDALDLRNAAVGGERRSLRDVITSLRRRQPRQAGWGRLCSAAIHHRCELVRMSRSSALCSGTEENASLRLRHS